MKQEAQIPYIELALLALLGGGKKCKWKQGVQTRFPKVVVFYEEKQEVHRGEYARAKG
jgi:hypothetical protein